MAASVSTTNCELILGLNRLAINDSQEDASTTSTVDASQGLGAFVPCTTQSDCNPDGSGLNQTCQSGRCICPPGSSVQDVTLRCQKEFLINPENIALGSVSLIGLSLSCDGGNDLYNDPLGASSTIGFAWMDDPSAAGYSTITAVTINFTLGHSCLTAGTNVNNSFCNQGTGFSSVQPSGGNSCMCPPATNEISYNISTFGNYGLGNTPKNFELSPANNGSLDGGSAELGLSLNQDLGSGYQGSYAQVIVTY